VDLTPINVGSVQRSVILPALLGGLVLTGGPDPDWKFPGPNEAGAFDVSDGLGAGPVDDGTTRLGDRLAASVPVADGRAGAAGASPGLPSSNLALRGFFTLSFVGYGTQGVGSTSKENMPLKRRRQHYTINRREVYAPKFNQIQKTKGDIHQPSIQLSVTKEDAHDSVVCRATRVAVMRIPSASSPCLESHWSQLEPRDLRRFRPSPSPPLQPELLLLML
jgi:hypothetical protein